MVAHFQPRVCSVSSFLLARSLWLVAVFIVCASTSRAQTTVYWDTNSTTAGSSGSTTAAGTWAATSNTNWSTSSGGTGSTNTWNSIAGGNKIAVFSAGTNATGTYTVTVSGTVANIAGMTFEEGNVTLSGGTVDLGANSTFNVASGASGYFSSALTGAFGVNKTGSGTLTFNGSKTFSGGLTVTDGTLRAEGSNTGTLGAGTLTLAGGTLDLAHTAGVNYGRNTTVSADSTILSNRSSAGAGVTYTLGTLSIGGQTLSVASGSGVTSGTAGLTFGATTFTGNSTLNVGTGAQLTLGAINTSGAARDLTKDGAGLLVLGSASGTITSGTDFIVASGTARVTNSSALGSGVTNLILNPTVASGTAVFDIAGNGISPTLLSVTFGGAGAGAGSTASITSSSGNTSTGLTLAGGVTYDATNNPGAATISSRVFLGSSNRTFNIGNSTATDAELTASNIISGTGGIIKTGEGTLALSGANTFTGARTISDGVVSIGAITNTATAGALGQNNSLILDGGTLRYTGVTASSNRVITLANSKTSELEVGAANAILTISGATASTTGALNKTGAGTLLLSATNQHSGGTIVTEGTLRATAAGSLGTGTLTLAGGTLDLANNTGTNFGRNTIVTASSTLSSNRTSSGAGVTHTLGTLSIGSQTLTVNAGSLVTSGTAGITFGATTLTGSSSFDVGSNVLLTLGALSDGGVARSLTKTGAGTLTLGTAAGTVTDGTSVTLAAGTLNSNNATALGSVAAVTVNGGTLNLGASQTFGSLAGSGGTVNLNANTLTVGNTNNLSGTFNGAIAGSGGLVKSGTGTLALGGTTSNYSGTTTVSQGTLQIDANAPSGSAGALGNATSAVTLNNGSTGSNNTALLIGASGVTIGRDVTVANQGSGTTTLGGNIASGTGTFGGAVTLGRNTTFTADGSSNITFSGAIGGAGRITKTGAGTITLSNANNYAGGTWLSAGTLAVGHNSALGSGTVTFDGGALAASGGSRTIANAISVPTNLTVGGSENLTFTNAITLGGGTHTFMIDNTGTTTFAGGITQPWYSNIVKDGNGRLVLSAASSFTGTATVAGGTLALQNSGALGGSTWGNVVSNGATLELSNNIAVSEGGFTVTGSGYNSAGAIRNLSGNNTLSAQVVLGGATTINSSAGTLTLDTYSDLGGNTLTVGGAGNTTFSAQVGGSGGGITKTGAGTLTLSGGNSYTGATTINDGVLVAAHATALGTQDAGTTVNSGGSLGLQGNVSILYENITVQGAGYGGAGAIRNLSGSNTLNQTVALANNATIGSDAGTLTLNQGLTGTNRNLTVTGAGNTSITGSIATGSGTLTKEGAGTLTLNSASTFTGNTTVSAGTLNIRNNTALGSGTGNVTVGSGATLQLQGGITVSGRPLSLGGTLESVSGNNAWSSNVTLTGNASILSSTAGQLLTIGPGDFSGLITMGSNTLTVGGAGNVLINSIVGATGNTGGFIKTGSGTVTFYGDENRYTGTTDVRDGTLVLDTLNFPMIDKTILGDLIIGDGVGGIGSAVVRYGTGLADNKIANTSNITINADGLLDLNSRDDTVGGITLQGGRIVTGTGVLELSGNIATLASAQEAQISGVMTLGSDTRVFNIADGAATSDLTVSAKLNFGGIVKEGLGRMTITSDNTVGYGGVTSVNAGILTITSSTALGQHGSGAAVNGTVVASNAALEIQGGLNIVSERIALSGTGYQGDGSGALRSVSGNNTLGGPIVLNDHARINTDAGLLTINGGITGSSKNLTVGGAGNTTINGAVGTSAGTFTKDGTGTVILTGDNTYSGTSTVVDGVLNIRHNNALGSTLAGTTVNSGAELQLQNNISVGNESLSLSGTGDGSNTGALRNISGNNSWGGAITVASSSARINSDAGTLTLGNTVALGSNTLTVGGASNTTVTGQLTGSSSSVLNKDGAGTLTLSNSTNTFSGDVNVQNGKLAFGANNALNSSSIDLAVGSNGTVDLVSFAQSVGTIAGAGLIDFNTGGQLSLASTSTWSGTFTGSGTIVIGAGVTLTLASNIYAPNVNIILAGGTLNMADGEHVFGNLTVTGNSTLNFSGSSTFEIENLFFSSLDYMLSIVNWTENEDFFYSRTQPGDRFQPPLNQVTFGPSGGPPWDGSHTRWQDWDSQITPVPEPSTYGAMLMGAGIAFFGFRRWRRQRANAAKK